MGWTRACRFHVIRASSDVVVLSFYDARRGPLLRRAGLGIPPLRTCVSLRHGRFQPLPSRLPGGGDGCHWQTSVDAHRLQRSPHGRLLIYCAEPSRFLQPIPRIPIATCDVLLHRRALSPKVSVFMAEKELAEWLIFSPGRILITRQALGLPTCALVLAVGLDRSSERRLQPRQSFLSAARRRRRSRIERTAPSDIAIAMKASPKVWDYLPKMLPGIVIAYMYIFLADISGAPKVVTREGSPS